MNALDVSREFPAPTDETRPLIRGLDARQGGHSALGGKDRYRIPATTRPQPANGARFGHRGSGLAAAFGIAADAETDSGVHAAPPSP